MQPLDYCREKTQTSHSNFLASFRFLAPPQRDAMTILYAYCRELDDLVDNSRDPSIARATLAWWRQEFSKPTPRLSIPSIKLCAASAPLSGCLKTS